VIKIKVAIISDIHGNSVALKEVIKDAQNNNVDDYIFLGDLINDFPFGNETLNIVKSISNKVLKGNKEQYLIEYDEEKYKWDNIQFKNNLFMYNELTKENLEYLKKLPHCMKVEYEGVKLFLAHGSPKSVEELLNRNKRDLLDKYTKDLDEDALIFGHTHEPMWYEYINNKLILNAGCVGVCPHYKGKAEYVILEISNGKILNIDLRLVSYNIEEVKKKIIESGILKYDKVLMNIAYSVISGNGEIKKQFLQDAKEMAIARHGKWYKDDAKGIYTYFKLYDDDIWLSLAEKYKKYFEF
jgi:putative phosphoesterase